MVLEYQIFESGQASHPVGVVIGSANGIINRTCILIDRLPLFLGLLLLFGLSPTVVFCVSTPTFSHKISSNRHRDRALKYQVECKAVLQSVDVLQLIEPQLVYKVLSVVKQPILFEAGQRLIQRQE